MRIGSIHDGRESIVAGVGAIRRRALLSGASRAQWCRESSPMFWSQLMVFAILWIVLAPGVLLAQVTPGGALPPPDDTPSVRVGGTLFLDYTTTLDPKATDADGNEVTANAFNVGRAYINVTGQVNHLIAFRITPDITRESGSGSSLSGSLTYRLKYAFAQFNLDDWMWRGTYVRFGMTQTPYVEFEESVYRYRFQGPVFVDVERFLTSSDFGVFFRTEFPNGYGEAIVGLYNGDGSTRADANDQKAFQVRATLRPLPGPGVLRGLRLTLFYDGDNYVKDAERNRFVSLVTYEHRFVNIGWSYLDATDQTLSASPEVDANGHSFWFTPRWAHGTLRPTPATGQVRASLEGLFRYDRLEPDQGNSSHKERIVAGVAYWPRMTNSRVSTAVLLDYEEVRYRNYAPARDTDKKVAVHMLINF
jgi:hypothetical protein